MESKMLTTVLAVLLIGSTLTGCNNEQKTPKSAQSQVKKYGQVAVLEGTVSSNEGLVKSGKLDATDENGKVVIASTDVENGHYQIEIPANTTLPILLSYTPESGSEKLTAAVIHESIKKYEINPLSTKIAEAAKAMGGYTHANMTRAAESTTHTPDANKTTTGWRGDPTTQYGGWH